MEGFKKFWRAWTRFGWKTTKIIFWIAVFVMTYKGALYSLGQLAPEHMRSYTEHLPDGGKIIYDGRDGLSYYIEPDTPSGTTIKPVPVIPSDPAPWVQKDHEKSENWGKTHTFTFSGQAQ